VRTSTAAVTAAIPAVGAMTVAVDAPIPASSVFVAGSGETFFT